MLRSLSPDVMGQPLWVIWEENRQEKGSFLQSIAFAFQWHMQAMLDHNIHVSSAQSGSRHLLITRRPDPEFRRPRI